MARWRLIWALAAAAALALTSLANERDTQKLCSGSVARPATGIDTQRPAPRPGLDEIIFFEDWESGDMAGWTGIDLTAAPSAWHRDDYQAFGGSGMSWWMGDTTVGANGGYNNSWYQALDSPPITLGATPSLLFYHRYRVENSPPSDPYPAGYNAWDGVNLRISTNNGSTWTIVPGTALTPTYQRTSLYGFGSPQGGAQEGPNIPGWVSSQEAWIPVTANLTAWAGQAVKLRWAFASDEGWSTPDESALFGWMVDNVRVYNGANDTTFSSNADADDGFTHQSLTGDPVGNFWRLTTDNTSPHGSFVLVCNDPSTNLYVPNMDNVIESPLIPLGNIGFGTLIADFSFRGTVLCTQPEFPDCDFIGFQVSADSGASWCYMSNPGCDTLLNYVYILGDAPNPWAGFNESFQTEQPIPYRNGALKFRITFESNATNQAVGLFVDGFQLEFLGGFPNDVSCYTMQVRYPNMVSRPTRVKAYFRNEGSDPQNGVQTWYQTIGFPRVAFTPPIDFAVAGEVETRQANVTFTAPVDYDMLAYSALTTDGNLQNDTSYCPAIEVQPASSNLELGHDNRTIQWRFNYDTGNGAMVRFTPVTDTVVTGNFDITTVRAQFASEQVGDLPIRLKIYRGSAIQPVQLLYDQQITVLQSETGVGVWKDIDVSADPDLQNVNFDFWVWFQVVSTDPVDRFPQILGDDAQPWADIHNFTWTGTGVPPQSTFFYQIHAVVDASLAADDQVTELPAAWNLAQNYPNPFNPATEIRYSVPKAERMTLKVFNLVGQEVATLVNGVVQPGVYTATFDASDLPSGVYVYRLESDSYTASHKMLLMK